MPRGKTRGGRRGRGRGARSGVAPYSLRVRDGEAGVSNDGGAEHPGDQALSNSTLPQSLDDFIALVRRIVHEEQSPSESDPPVLPASSSQVATHPLSSATHLRTPQVPSTSPQAPTTSPTLPLSSGSLLPLPVPRPLQLQASAGQPEPGMSTSTMCVCGSSTLGRCLGCCY